MPRQTSHWAGRDAPPHAPGAGLPGPKPARSGGGPGLRTDERPKGEFSTTEDRGRSPSPGLHRAATRTPRPLVCGSSSASRGGTPQDQGSAMLLSWVRAREHTHHKGFHKEEGPRWRQGTRAPPPGDPHCIGLPRLPSLPSLPSLWVSAATRTLPGGRAGGGAGPACTEACQGHRERPRHSSPTSQGPKDGSPRPAPRPPTRQQGAPRRHIQAHWGNLRHTPDTTGKPKPLAPPLPQDFRQDSPPLRKPSLFLCSLPLSLSLSVPPAVTLSLASARAPKLSLLCWTHPTHDQPLALTRVCPCQPALQEPQHGRTDATLP